MLGRVFLGILMSGAIVGSALAQPADSDYELLSTGSKSIVDALYSAQQPILDSSGQTIVGMPSLTRDDIASMHSGGGWGVAFQDLKDRGYYPDAKNLGQVISGAHKQVGTVETAATDADRGQLLFGSGQAGGRFTGDKTSKSTKRPATRSRQRLARRTTTRLSVSRSRVHHVRPVHRSGLGRGKK